MFGTHGVADSLITAADLEPCADLEPYASKLIIFFNNSPQCFRILLGRSRVKSNHHQGQQGAERTEKML